MEGVFPSPFLGHFFHSIKVYHPSNYIDWEKEQTWPIYNTVNSPLFQALSQALHFMLLSALWSLHCPLSPPQGKRGESQINPFNYLLAMLVRQQEENKGEPPLQLKSSSISHFYLQASIPGKNVAKSCHALFTNEWHFHYFHFTELYWMIQDHFQSKQWQRLHHIVLGDAKQRLSVLIRGMHFSHAL